MSALSTRSRPSPRLWNLREGSSPALLPCLRPGWGRQGGWRDTWLCHHHTSIRTADTRVTMFANWNLHQCLSPALLCLPDKVFILETNAHDTPFWLHHSRFLWIYFLLFYKQIILMVIIRSLGPCCHHSWDIFSQQNRQWALSAHECLKIDLCSMFQAFQIQTWDEWIQFEALYCQWAWWWQETGQRAGDGGHKVRCAVSSDQGGGWLL